MDRLSWWEEFKDALECVRQRSFVLWGAGTAAVSILWGAATAGWVAGRVFDMPSWVLLFAASLILLLAGVFQTLVHERRKLRPNVVPDFSEAQGGVVDIREDRWQVGTDGVPRNVGSHQARYVRGRVATTSPSGASACSAFIIGITKHMPDGQKLKAPLYDAIELGWSNRRGHTELPVHPEVPMHFDIARARSDEPNALVICGAVPNTMEGFLGDQADYVFEIKVVADHVAANPLAVRVRWTGNWSDMRAEPAVA